MNNEPKRRIIVRAQTADEEFDHLMRVLGRIDFYNEHGYKFISPDHPFFQNIVSNPKLLESTNIEEAKNIFKKEVYDLGFFKNGLRAVKESVGLMEKAVDRMEEWQSWGFKLFSEYEVRLTAYGTGGSYLFESGDVVMIAKKSGKYGMPPLHIVVHEILHLGIEESIIKRFNLTHAEREGLVDAICAKCFDDLLVDYLVRDRWDKEIFRLVSKENIMSLPQVIAKHKEGF